MVINISWSITSCYLRVDDSCRIVDISIYGDSSVYSRPTVELSMSPPPIQAALPHDMLSSTPSWHVASHELSRLSQLSCRGLLTKTRTFPTWNSKFCRSMFCCGFHIQRSDKGSHSWVHRRIYAEGNLSGT